MDKNFLEQLIDTNDFEKISDYSNRLWFGDKTVEKDRAASFILLKKAYELNPNDNLITRRIGICYRSGYGVEVDTEKSLKYFLEAAEREDTTSQYFMGLTYREQHNEKAVDWFEKALKNGDLDAAVELGTIFLSGEIVEKDIKRAEKYFEIVKASNDDSVKMDVMRVYYFGPYNNGEVNLDKAIEWCKYAAQDGNEKAISNLKTLYNESGMPETEYIKYLESLENNGPAFLKLYQTLKDTQPEKALEYLEKSVELNYSDAYSHLGRVYYFGFCNQQVDKNKALSIWQKGSENGDSESTLMCAYERIQGEMSPRDTSRGIELFEKASEMGNCTAQKELGIIYLFGYYNKEINYEKAFNYFDSASKLDIDSDVFLGYMYCLGLFVDKDFEKGLSKFDESIENESRLTDEFLLKTYRGVGLTDEERVAILKKASDHNNTEAMTILANFYENGVGVPKDSNIALDLIYKAMDLGEPDAYFQLGNMYFKGTELLEKNGVKAIENYNKSFEIKETAYVAKALLDCYYFANGTEKNLKEAEEWAKKAIRLGHREAVHNLLTIEAELFGEEKAFEMFFDFIFEEGIKCNDEALVMAYKRCREKGNAEEALSYINNAHKNGNPNACYILGELYFSGADDLGISKDIDKAYLFWQHGIAVNSPECMNKVGQAYLRGENLHKDAERGLNLIKEAAKRGHKTASFDVYTHLILGFDGIQTNISEAMEYLKLSAAQGNPVAQKELATYYIEGNNGIEKDIDIAIDLLNKSAAQNFSDAYLVLANLYLNGIGVPVDVVKTQKYLKAAAELGNQTAKDLLKEANITNFSEDGEFEIKDGVLVRYNGNAGNIIIPDGVTKISRTAFSTVQNNYHQIGIGSIYISKTVEEIDEDTFSNILVPWTDFAIDAENENFAVEDGVLFNKSKTILLRFPTDKSISTYTIPSTVAEIKPNAFRLARRVSEVIGNEKIEKIGNDCFAASRIRKIDVSKTKITELPENFAMSGYELTEVRLPKCLKHIGKNAFFGNNTLTRIELPEFLETIDSCAFANNSGLQYVGCPKRLKSIGETAFFECPSLTSITIPRNTKLGDNAFPSNCRISYFNDNTNTTQNITRTNNPVIKQSSFASQSSNVSNSNSTKKSDSSSNSNTGKTIGIIIAVVVILALAVFGIVKLVQHNNSNNGFYGKENIISNLSEDEQYRLNMFISNFAEVEFDDYQPGDYSDEQIIDFSILHNYANNNGGIKYSSDSDSVSLKAKTVKENATRFFDESISCTSTSLTEYNATKDTFYASAEELNNHNQYAPLRFNEYYSMAIVDEMFDNEDGTYSVTFTVYTSSNKLKKDYYYYDAEQARSDNQLSEAYSGSAVVRDYYVDSINKYQLVSYSTYN